MKNVTLVGIAAVLFSVLGGPALARQVISSPSRSAQSIFCATREPGNPHSKYCDYIEWSKWRQRGGWDSTRLPTPAQVTSTEITRQVASVP